MLDLEQYLFKLHFAMKIKKFRSKYNTLEVCDWSVMQVMSLDRHVNATRSYLHFRQNWVFY